MDKYIDADLLREGIEENQYVIVPLFNRGDDSYYEGEYDGYNRILDIIDSLQREQPEVDLEKDVESWFFKEISPKINIEHTMYYYFQECAHRYYELGLKARKEE